MSSSTIVSRAISYRSAAGRRACSSQTDTQTASKARHTPTVTSAGRASSLGIRRASVNCVQPRGPKPASIFAAPWRAQGLLFRTRSRVGASELGKKRVSSTLWRQAARCQGDCFALDHGDGVGHRKLDTPDTKAPSKQVRQRAKCVGDTNHAEKRAREALFRSPWTGLTRDPGCA